MTHPKRPAFLLLTVLLLGLVPGLVASPAGATAAVTTVEVSPATQRLQVDQVIAMIALPRDASGAIVPQRPVTWHSSDPQIVSIAGDGFARAVSGGTVTITATVDGVRGASTVSVNARGTTTTPTTTTPTTTTPTTTTPTTTTPTTTTPTTTPTPTTTAPAPTASTVTAPAAGTAIGSPAELPRHYVDTSMPAMSGRLIRVPAGDSAAFRRALAEAVPGDVIELPAGASFVGSFNLPAKDNPGNQWITIRSSKHAQLPAPGQRVTPTHSRLMPRLLGGGANKPAIHAPAGANHYRLVGLDIGLDVGSGTLPAITNDVVDLAYGSHHIVLDRTYVHGAPEKGLQRCITLNNAWSAVVDSYVDDCHAKGFDSQAILGWKGPGPFKIVNNYLAGAGENIMFGGAVIGTNGQVPADIEIRGNHIIKPLSWRGKWTIKNLFELKIAERVLVEGNIFENNWADAQTGFAFVIKSENRDAKFGRYEDIATRDVTIRNNRIVNSLNGFSLTGGASTARNTGRGRTERILIENNHVQITGRRMWQVGGINDLTITENHIPGLFLYTGRRPSERFVMTNNIMRGINSANGMGNGLSMLAKMTPGFIFDGNALFIPDTSFRDYRGSGNEIFLGSELGSYTGPAGPDRAVLDAAVRGVVAGVLSQG